jgi:predicted XRE-type DNA-binding protein
MVICDYANSPVSGADATPRTLEGVLQIVVRYDNVFRELWVNAARKDEGATWMKERIDLIHGSGNVFRDLRYPNADVEQLKSILAAEIIKALDRDRLTVREAHARTRIAAADFSRIRNADLDRFTIDRLMTVMNRLGKRVEVTVRVKRADAMNRAAT